VTFFLGDRWVEAPRGSFVLAPGGMTHDFENRSSARAGFVNVSVPGNFEEHMPGIAEWFRERTPESAYAPSEVPAPEPSPVPEGQKLFAYLVLRDASSAIAFYERAFGAKEAYRLEMGGGKIGHAEIAFEGVTVMLADEFPDMGILGPQGSSPVSILFYVENVDAFAERAVTAGAKLEKPVTDEFYGDRVAALIDPFGHRWLVHSRRELVTPEQMRERMKSAR
jgi:PhnB protein